jgi:hypothetical protein
VNPRLAVYSILVLIWPHWAGPQGPLDSQAAAGQGPIIRLSPDHRTIDVIGLGQADLRTLTKAALSVEQWRSLFAIYVQTKSKAGPTDLPPVLGSYHVDENAVHFKPRFPLEPGIRYRAVFQPAEIPGRKGDQREPVVAETFFAKPAKEPTVVQQIYPSAALWPENQLRFYIHFSAPMRPGDAYEHLHLLDSAGKTAEHPFLELDEELWDPHGMRLTLLFHPGRIKKGLKPREELGPILEAGKSYTLVIDRNWLDAEGNPLKEEYRKTFRAVAAAEKSPDPRIWSLQSPPSGSRLPLRVRFPEPLDHALLERMLWITDASGRKIPGTIAVIDQERGWQLTPSHPWQAGGYRLVIDTRLEDSAGNSIRRPFEVDVFHPVQRRVTVETVELSFQVRPLFPH